jgi:Glyoxalase/Bleomycin resistance protein/Dioxygenase superfamily
MADLLHLTQHDVFSKPDGRVPTIGQRNTMTQHPTVNGILEAVLYVDDVERSMRFYKQLFGFETEVQADLIGVLRVPGDQALIFFPNASPT